MLKRKSKETFIPRFPKKYKGKYPIYVMSQWEKLFFQWVDANLSVIEWSSETITIPYYDPVRTRNRLYYPDVLFKVKDKNGDIKKYLVEIKPFHETHPPKKTKKKSKKTLKHQEETYITNTAKWNAAISYCKKTGLTWKILTEKELFRK